MQDLNNTFDVLENTKTQVQWKINGYQQRCPLMSQHLQWVLTLGQWSNHIDVNLTYGCSTVLLSALTGLSFTRYCKLSVLNVPWITSKNSISKQENPQQQTMTEAQVVGTWESNHILSSILHKSAIKGAKLLKSSFKRESSILLLPQNTKWNLWL